jgi:hypothetical protein
VCSASSLIVGRLERSVTVHLLRCASERAA